MLFKYIFLIDYYKPGMISSFGHEFNDELIIPLTGEMLDNRKEFFNDLSASGHQFAFLISAEIVNDYIENSESNLIQSITSLLFLPNYIRNKGCQVIFINGKSQPDNQLTLFSVKFKSELDGQGVDNIAIETLDTNPPENYNRTDEAAVINEDLISYLKEKPVAVSFDEYFKRLLRFPLLTQKWVIPIDSPETFLHYHSLIKKLEFYFVSKEPILAYYINNYNLLESSVTKLRNENRLLTIKQQNSMHYLKILRQTSLEQIHQLAQHNLQKKENLIGEERSPNADMLKEIEYLQKNRDTIQEWYTKEYEILPRWYKRIGHLIKVLMGKRTFRSLFK
jgi:hypothetical protein